MVTIKASDEGQKSKHKHFMFDCVQRKITYIFLINENNHSQNKQLKTLTYLFLKNFSKAKVNKKMYKFKYKPNIHIYIQTSKNLTNNHEINKKYSPEQEFYTYIFPDIIVKSFEH